MTREYPESHKTVRIAHRTVHMQGLTDQIGDEQEYILGVRLRSCEVYRLLSIDNVHRCSLTPLDGRFRGFMRGHRYERERAARWRSKKEKNLKWLNAPVGRAHYMLWVSHAEMRSLSASRDSENPRPLARRLRTKICKTITSIRYMSPVHPYLLINGVSQSKFPKPTLK